MKTIVWGYAKSWIAFQVRGGKVVWESRWFTTPEAARCAAKQRV